MSINESDYTAVAEDGAAIAANLDRFGLCLVRGAIPSATCEFLNETITRNAAAWPREGIQSYVMPLYFCAHQSDWPAFENYVSRAAQSNPFAPPEWRAGDIAFIESTLVAPLKKSGAWVAVSSWLGRSDGELRPNHSMTRRSRWKGLGSSWHQDGVLQNSAENFITAWITFTPCGVDAPALSFVPQRFTERVEPDNGSAVTDAHVSTFERHIPAYSPGDLVLHTPLTLHGTFPIHETPGIRTSVDLRFF